MGRSKKGRCVKCNKQLNLEEKKEDVEAPHSFVIHRGLSGDHVVELTRDFRRVLEPYTASALKERKNNSIKDFISISGIFHVTSMCIFSRTDHGMYLKMCRIPRGPTLTFKVLNFSLARDVVSALKKQMVFEEAFKHAPIIVLNNFSGEGLQMKLMASMFQNMFPTINLTTVNLSNIRRCVCLNYNTSTKTIDFRHYAIKVVPVGLSRGIKKIVQSKIPNLSRCNDFSDFLMKPTMSESEAEDEQESHVKLSQKLSSRGNHEESTSAIRLYELGPRLTLQLIKVENGLLDGEVLYHELIQKTEEEKRIIQMKRQEKMRLKEKRRKTQDQNKRNKEKLKEENKEKSLKGMKNKSENELLMKKLVKESNEANPVEKDDDAEYFRQEVGMEPEKELFGNRTGEKRKKTYGPKYSKKAKINKTKEK